MTPDAWLAQFMARERLPASYAAVVAEVAVPLAGRIAADYPPLGAAVGVRLAVNHKYVPLNHVLCDGDEVAVIPPVSGG